MVSSKDKQFMFRLPTVASMPLLFLLDLVLAPPLPLSLLPKKKHRQQQPPQLHRLLQLLLLLLQIIVSMMALRLDLAIQPTDLRQRQSQRTSPRSMSVVMNKTLIWVPIRPHRRRLFTIAPTIPTTKSNRGWNGTIYMLWVKVACFS